MEEDSFMKSIELWKLSFDLLKTEWESNFFDSVTFTFENNLETLKRNKESLKILQGFNFDDKSPLSFSVYHLLNYFVDEDSIPIYDDFDTFSQELEYIATTNKHDALLDDQHKNVLLNLLKRDNPFELHQDQVTLFFSVCSRLKVRQPIRFRALEIYERFLKRSSQEIVNSNMKKGGTVSDNSIDWSQFIVIGSVPYQLLLWMSVCILLADKLENEQKCLTAKDIEWFLCPLSEKFTSKLVHCAELVVLKKLEAYISWKLPHELMENLLVYCDLSPTKHQIVYMCCMLILRMIYVQNEPFKIQYFLTRINELTQESNTYSYGIWLTAGVVAAGIHIVLGNDSVSSTDNEKTKTAVARISSHTDIDIAIVADLAKFIKEEYLKVQELSQSTTL